MRPTRAVPPAPSSRTATASAPPTPGRVTVLTVGSRGDVQPYLALAQGLARAGLDVTLAAPERLGWLAEGLPLRVIGLRQEPLRAVRDAWTVRSSRGLLNLRRRLRSALHEAMDEWSQAIAGSSLVVAHPQVFAAPEIARLHGATAVFADTLPVSCPSREYPCCYFLGRSWGSLVNRASYHVLPWALLPQRRWAADWLRTRGARDVPSRRWDLHGRDGSPVPHLHGHSAAVLPAPADWPPEWSVTGYWRMDPPEHWLPDPRLAEYLRDGPPPVYVGFGSMVYGGDRRRLTRELVGPLLDRGERVLLVRGWALSGAGFEGEPQVHFLDAYEGPWHSWLFSRVRAVVHHGGPGTFGAALHAGRPQACVPFAMDQPFWARRAWTLGVAPEPLAMRRWSARAWESRVEILLPGEPLRARAEAMARRLDAEDGVSVALDTLRRIAGARLPPAMGSA